MPKFHLMLRKKLLKERNSKKEIKTKTDLSLQGLFLFFPKVLPVPLGWCIRLFQATGALTYLKQYADRPSSPLHSQQSSGTVVGREVSCVVLLVPPHGFQNAQRCQLLISPSCFPLFPKCFSISLLFYNSFLIIFFTLIQMYQFVKHIIIKILISLNYFISYAPISTALP